VFAGSGRKRILSGNCTLKRFDSHGDSNLFFYGIITMSRRIGTVSIFLTRRSSQANQVNSILSEYSDIIIGRMGLPYPSAGLHSLSHIVHGTTDGIGAVTGKLGSQEGVKVKSALQKIARAKKRKNREDFIRDTEIKDLLRKAASPDRKQVLDIIEKSRGLKGLTTAETAVLLQTDDPELLAAIYETARGIKQNIYGNRLVLFAPFYIANYCSNNCLY